MAAWQAAGLPQARIEIAEVAERPSGTVLDVRQQGEFASGHLPGARHVELGALTGADELPGGPLAVICGHGERSEEHTSELQSRENLVCRLLLEKKKTLYIYSVYNLLEGFSFIHESTFCFF